MVEIQNNENVQLRVEDNNQNLINNNQPNLIDVQNAENNSPLINEPFKDNPNFDLSNQQNPNNMDLSLYKISEEQRRIEALLEESGGEITPEIEGIAGGAGTPNARGGMATKIAAAKMATAAGIDMVIMNGEKPERLYDLLMNDEPVGTRFTAQ